MKNKRIPVLAVILAVLAILLTAVPAAAVDEAVLGRYVISIPQGKKLICRSEPSSESSTVDYLTGGEIVEVVELRGNWARTFQNGKNCWFALKYGVLRTKYECAELIADISSASASEVDFGKLAGLGVKGVILRFGVSMNSGDVIAEDMYLMRNYNAAVAAGLKVGLFFSSSALKTTEIRKETDWTITQFKALGLKLSLPVFYSPLAAAKQSLSQSDNTLNASFFCKTLEDAGIEAGVYLPADWTTKNLSFENLGSYAHWIADYGDYCNFSSTYDIWQYVNNASVEGVKGMIGLNYMFRDVSAASSAPVAEPSSTASTEPTSEPTSVPSTEAPTEPTTEPTTLPVPEHKEGKMRTVTEAGCESWGLEAAYCEDCGKLMHTRPLQPVGHKEGAWIVVSAPTDSAAGLAVKYCTVCGKLIKEHILTVDGDAHIHSFSQWNVADDQGLLAADSKLYPNPGPAPAEEGSTAPAEVGTTASGNEGVTAPAEQSQTDVTAIDPSLIGKYPCTSQQEIVLRCLDCGKIIERTYAVPAAHTPAAERSVSAADCEKDGHNAIVCAVCGAAIEDEITPAYGHSVVDWKVVKAASVGQKGERSGVCRRCGKTVTEEIPEIAAKLGDVNQDGKITSTDARMILQAAAKTLSFTDAQAQIGDVDGNGKITASDARTVLRVAAKIQTLD